MVISKFRILFVKFRKFIEAEFNAKARKGCVNNFVKPLKKYLQEKVLYDILCQTIRKLDETLSTLESLNLK